MVWYMEKLNQVWDESGWFGHGVEETGLEELSLDGLIMEKLN